MFSRSCLSSTLRPLTSNRLIAEMIWGKTDLPAWNVFTPTHPHPHTLLTHTPHTHTPPTPHSHWRQVAARCYTSGESMVVVTLHPQSLSLVRYLISCLHGNTCCYGCRRRLQLRKRNWSNISVVVKDRKLLRCPFMFKNWVEGTCVCVCVGVWVCGCVHVCWSACYREANWKPTYEHLLGPEVSSLQVLQRVSTVYHSMYTRTSWGSGSVYLRMLSSKSTPRELRCSTRGWVSCVPPTPVTLLCTVGHVIMLRNNTPPPSPHRYLLWHWNYWSLPC